MPHLSLVLHVSNALLERKRERKERERESERVSERGKKKQERARENKRWKGSNFFKCAQI